LWERNETKNNQQGNDQALNQNIFFSNYLTDFCGIFRRSSINFYGAWIKKLPKISGQTPEIILVYHQIFQAFYKNFCRFHVTRLFWCRILQSCSFYWYNLFLCRRQGRKYTEGKSNVGPSYISSLLRELLGSYMRFSNHSFLKENFSPPPLAIKSDLNFLNPRGLILDRCILRKKRFDAGYFRRPWDM